MNEMDLAGFRQADRVVCSARSYQDLLLKGGVSAPRLAYIPWGVDCERIDAALATRRQSGGVHIGFVGRIEPRKGQLDLIAAFDLIRRRVPGAHLHLVGPEADPAYADRCRTEIARRALGAQVTWHGHVPDVARRLVEWTLFVSLSSDEGQGLAMQEAMAAQVPVLALAAPGIVDFVTDRRTGRLVHSRGARGVAAAAVEVLGDRVQSARLARAGSRLIRSRYSWPRCDAAIERLYR
jgi:glycosyltransferase involved in cell wall biosynthesis